MGWGETPFKERRSAEREAPWTPYRSCMTIRHRCVITVKNNKAYIAYIKVRPIYAWMFSFVDG